MTAHKHAALMLQYAQDAQETDEPWLRWEFSNGNGQWFDALTSPSWASETIYRRKPKMISATCADGTVVTWPEPLREAPDVGTVYYIPDPTDTDGYYCYSEQWVDADCDRIMLKNGMVHLTKEDAIQHTKAQICLNNGSANWEQKE